MSAERVFQAAVYAALAADGTYMGLISGLFDGEAPKGTAYPFSLLGAMTEVPDHTHDHEGFEVTLTMHDWSGVPGNRECQLIREARNAVLHRAALSVSGWGLTQVLYEWGEVLTEWDDDLKRHIRHQVTRYRVRALATT